MIVYSGCKRSFSEHVKLNVIAEKINNKFNEVLGHRTSPNEFRAWQNSMMYMKNILEDNEIPDDAGIAIEYKIPMTSNRVDFIVTGENKNKNEVAIIIELKQWETANETQEDAIVETFVGGGIRKVPHPSYQAWSYAKLISDFSEIVQEDSIDILPCAYLHNYTRDGRIDSAFYHKHIENAPLFLRNDTQLLTEFIKSHVKFGDSKETLFRIDHGRVKPSKALSDSLCGLLSGNKEFILIDDQKVIYEEIMKHSRNLSDTQKKVVIIEGGPGTGKSVIAINLLVNLIRESKLSKYVTRNSAPREVYESKLTGTLRRSQISNLFSGSGKFHNISSNLFDVLIVDEAHRLNEKSGMFKNYGENQIKEIIGSSKLSVFFIDENQKVTLHDIGDKQTIRKFANKFDAVSYEMSLTSQFRCNGSDGYLAWLDNILQIRDTANESITDIDYDFKVIDNPLQLKKIIEEKNRPNNKARLVAGYCWNWDSKKNPNKDDIIFKDFNFSAKWNLSNDGMLWIVKPDSVKEIGCIHTCQGLEVDYIGVIIGPDLIVRNNEIITDASKRAKSDSSIKGYKKLIKENPIEGKARIDQIIKNTYRTLMTRGQKGCYIYSVDNETQEYFRRLLQN